EVRSVLGSLIAGESVAARTARDEVAAVRRRLDEHVAPADPQPPAAADTGQELAVAAGVPAVSESIRRAVASPRSVALSPVQQPAGSRVAAIRDRWIDCATQGLPAPWRESVHGALPTGEAFFRHVWQALQDEVLPSSTDRVARRQRLVGLIAGALGLALLIAGAGVFASSVVLGASLAGAGVPLLLVCAVLVIL